MDMSFMDEAVKEAYDGINNGHGGPFGAVIVKDGKIVGRGHNCVVVGNDPTAHGEITAIRDACKNLGTFILDGCEMYSTAEPCPMCCCAILWAGISRVYYGCDVNDTENINFRDSKFYEMMKDGKLSFMVGVDKTACLKLFEDYSALKNKTDY